MGSVKTQIGIDTVAGRIRMIRRVLNPHGDGELAWPDFAAFAGVPLGTAKKWESRDGISEDSARHLAARLAAAGLPCSWEWVRHGTEPVPRWVENGPGGAQDESYSSRAGDSHTPQTAPGVGEVPAPYGRADSPSHSPDSLSTKGAQPAAPHVLSDTEHNEMRRQQAILVSEALGKVVDRHEVVGVDLRKVLIRMAAGLDALNHHDAAGEIYALLVKLNDLEIARKKKPNGST